jgi:hypothetical protein
MRSRTRIALRLLLGLGIAAAGPSAVAQEPEPQDAFWARLQALCGQAFAGQLMQAPPGDDSFSGRTLVMHVRECSETRIRIPFLVGDDRSRTWVLTRTAGGLRLKHDHRHEDGSEDAITQYGGDTQTSGSAVAQQFHADAHTSALIPAAATNVWTVELVPGQRYSYALERRGTDRRFRVDFDLSRSVESPAAPWGWAPDVP